MTVQFTTIKDRRTFRRLTSEGISARSGPLTLRWVDGPGWRYALAVGSDVGDAVARNRVKRRLRHLVAARVDRWREGALLIRAGRGATALSFIELGARLDAALDRLRERSAPSDPIVSSSG